MSAAHDLGIPVIALSGPSSITLAVAASGLNGQSFVFHGYLQTDVNPRRARLRELEATSKRLQQTQVFIETPYRNAVMLEAMHDQPWDVAWTMANAARTLMLQDWYALPERGAEATWWVAKSGPTHYGQHLPRLREWVAELLAERR